MALPQYVKNTSDSPFKRMMEIKGISATIIKLLVEEFREVPLSELVKWIESSIDEKTGIEYDGIVNNLNKVYKFPTGLSGVLRDKDSDKEEIELEYDVIFRVNVPKDNTYGILAEDDRLSDWFLINFEMQSKNTGDLLYRSEIYSSFMFLNTYMSKSTENKPYNKVRKIYSIWFCVQNLMTDRTKDNGVNMNVTFPLAQTISESKSVNDLDSFGNTSQTKSNSTVQKSTSDMFLHSFGTAQYYLGVDVKTPFYNKNYDPKSVLFIELNKLNGLDLAKDHRFYPLKQFCEYAYDVEDKRFDLSNLINFIRTSYELDIKEEVTSY